MEKSSDKFVLRPFTVDDYEQYSSWWEDPPQIEDLPKIGIVCGDMKAVGFLARTDCSFSIITWWYCNPKNTAKESHKALNIMFKELCALSAAMGRGKVFCYSNNRAIVKIAERLGFINYDGHLVGSFSNG
jgi:hypothetical protein